MEENKQLNTSPPQENANGAEAVPSSSNHGGDGSAHGSSFAEDRNGQSHHPIAEFLYQLTKMLTDDNSEIILGGWSHQGPLS